MIRTVDELRDALLTLSDNDRETLVQVILTGSGMFKEYFECPEKIEIQSALIDLIAGRM